MTRPKEDNERLLRTERERDEARAEVDRAKRALLSHGFTDCGGAEWKPPLGPHPGTLLAEVERLRRAQNERAIAKLIFVQKHLELTATAEGVSTFRRLVGDDIGRVRKEIAALRAEQAAAPTPQDLYAQAIKTPAAPSQAAGQDSIACGGPIYSEVGKCDREFGHSGTCEQAAPAPVTPPDSDEAWLRAPLTDEEIKAVEHATGSKVVTPPADAPQRPSVSALKDYRDAVHDSWEREDRSINATDLLQRAVRLLLDDALAARGGAK